MRESSMYFLFAFSLLKNDQGDLRGTLETENFVLGRNVSLENGVKVRKIEWLISWIKN